MVIKYHISPYPTLNENMIVRIYEAQSPEAVVFEQTLPQPHNAPVTITANGMDKVVHIVRLYAAISAVLLHEYNVEPTSDALTVFDPIRFKIGDGGPLTPAAGTRLYANPLLDGLADNEFEVIRNNYGHLFPVLYYANNTGFGGGFVLNTPDAFNDGEEFTIQRRAKITSILSDSVVGKWFAGAVDIDSDKAYEFAHLRKLLRFKGPFNYTFTAGVAVPIGYGFVFQNYNNTLQNGRVTFLNAPLNTPLGPFQYVDLKTYVGAMFVFNGNSWDIVYFADVSTSTTSQRGSIIDVGEINVGDVGPGDPIYQVTHGKNIAGDYGVQLSIRSITPALYSRNNRLAPTWWHHPTNKANSFYISLEELAGEVQSIAISWAIIKF